MSGNSSYSSAVEGTGAAGTPSTDGRLRLIDDSRTIVRPLSVTNSIRASRHCGGSGLSSPAPIHSPHADAIRGHQRLSSPAPIHSPHSAPCPLARLRAAPSNTARPQSMALSGHQVQSVVLWWRAVRTFEKTIVDRDARRARVDVGHSVSVELHTCRASHARR